MNATTFDTHGFVKRLTAAGMPERQAEVLADEQSRLLEGHLVTKRDLAEAKAEIMRIIAETKAEILKWMFAALLGQTAILAALIKLL